MGHPGVVGAIAILIAIGLILKFGGSSFKLTQATSKGITGETNALLMSSNPGNLPPGVVTA